jgi:hypothetical protein
LHLLNVPCRPKIKKCIPKEKDVFADGYKVRKGFAQRAMAHKNKKPRRPWNQDRRWWTI